MKWKKRVYGFAIKLSKSYPIDRESLHLFSLQEYDINNNYKIKSNHILWLIQAYDEICDLKS
jgi:hypothetical protein